MENKPKYTPSQKRYVITLSEYLGIVAVAVLLLSNANDGTGPDHLDFRQGFAIVGVFAILGLGHMLASHFSKH